MLLGSDGDRMSVRTRSERASPDPSQGVTRDSHRLSLEVAASHPASGPVSYQAEYFEHHA